MRKEARIIRFQAEKKSITSVDQVYKILMNEIERNYRIIKETESRQLF